MKIQINGQEREIESPMTLAALVESLGMKAGRVAVERNRDIVARESWAGTDLVEGDRLEIVHFVGGGDSTTEARRRRDLAAGRKSSKSFNHQGH